MTQPKLKPKPQLVLKKEKELKKERKLVKEKFINEELITHMQADEQPAEVDDLGIEVNPAQKLRNALQTHLSIHQKSTLPVTPQKSKTLPRHSPEPQPKDQPNLNYRVDIRQLPVAAQFNIINRQNQFNPFARILTPKMQKQINEKAEEKQVSTQKELNKIFIPRNDLPTQAVRNLLKPPPPAAKPQSTTSSFQAGDKLYTEKKTFS